MIKHIKQNQFLRNSFIFFCGSMLANFVNYLFHLYLGRSVSVETYGEVESLISLTNIISIPALTLAMVSTRYAAECKADGDSSGSRELLGYLYRRVLKWITPLFFVVLLLTPFIGKFLNISSSVALIIIWVIMYVSFFGAINNGILAGWQKFKELNEVGIYGSIVKLVFAVILVRLGLDVGGIIGSLLIGGLVTYAVSVIFLKFILANRGKKTDVHCETKVDFQSLRSYIMPVFAGNMAITILGNADIILARKNLDAVAAGQYGALSIISKIIFFLATIIAGVLFSMSAENKRKDESSSGILKQAILIVLLIASAVTTTYFLFPDFVLNLTFGDKYKDVASSLGWLAIAASLFSLVNIIFQYLISVSRTMISYVLLGMSIVSVAMLQFFGQTFSSLITMIIISQSAALAAAVILMIRKNKAYL